jgi:hypothetical protein
MNSIASLYCELFSKVESFFIRVRRDISHELFQQFEDMVQGKGDSTKVWKPITRVHLAVNNWLWKEIGNHVQESRIEVALIRINKPVEVTKAKMVISEISFPIHGDVKERFCPVNARELVSFLLEKVVAIPSCASSIVVVTSSIPRDNGCDFLPVIGNCENVNHPTRSLGIAPGRMVIPAGTTYLCRCDY